METCPTCGAAWSGAPDCRRCGSDLRLLLEVEAAARGQAARALAALATGDLAGALAAAAVAGLLNMALLPPIVVIAQEIVPEGAALMSGVVMGLAWAAGSVLVLGTGAVGDAFGPRTAALASTPVMLIAAALAAQPGLARHGRPRGGEAGMVG